MPGGVRRIFGDRRLLLVENYRSTEAIIESPNERIKHNTERSKRIADEQVITSHLINQW